MASYNFILDGIEQRSLAPYDYGSLEDVVTQNLSILFHFLDFGRNRLNEKAWGLLQANIEYLYNSSDMMVILNAFWKVRREWWPKFHNVPLPKISRRIRRKIFEFLK